MTDDAAAAVGWAIAGPEVYQRLVRWRGWSPVERWAADAVAPALFG